MMLCERGIRTFETAYRFTLDLMAVPVLKELSHLPVIVDPSHAAGRRDLVAPLSLAAAAVGADGIIVEVHPNPDEAICDGPQALRAEDFAEYAAPSSRPRRSRARRSARSDGAGRRGAGAEGRGPRRRADRRLDRPGRPRARRAQVRGYDPDAGRARGARARRDRRARRPSWRRPSPAPTRLRRGARRRAAETVARALAAAPAGLRRERRRLDQAPARRRRRADPRFIGGHPLAGAETAGVEHAREDLFEGATWYLTPGAGHRRACSTSACTALLAASAPSPRRSTPPTTTG